MVKENLFSPNFDLVYIKKPLCNQIRKYSWDLWFCVWLLLIEKLFSETEKVCFQMFCDNIWIRNFKNQPQNQMHYLQIKII